MKTYPLADRIPYANIQNQINIRAVMAGEFRCPKKGEWYLSGAMVEAYRAPNDLWTGYHIAKLVRVKINTIIEIIVDYREGD